MRLIDADEFDRMMKETHDLWGPLMDTDEKYQLTDVGLGLAASVARGMPTIEAVVIDRETQRSIIFAVANLCADALFNSRLNAAQKRRVLTHVDRLNALAGYAGAAPEIANALLNGGKDDG